MMASIDVPPHRVNPYLSRPFLAGLALTGAIAALAVWLGDMPWLKNNGIGVLTLAIVLGMLVGNTVYPSFAGGVAPGVNFSKTRLLRLGIILYGLRLTFQDVAQVGVAGLVIDTLTLTTTFALACVLGMRFLGMDRHTTLLIGAGASICGAAAVMAAEPVVKGKAEHVTVAVATVVVFGTIAMFLWPALYHAAVQGGWLQMTPHEYGVYVGSTVHEVAQVVVAGGAAGEEAAGAAVITKMVRVMMLAPFLMLLAYALSRRERGESGQASGGMMVPWFALGFIAVTAIHSTGILPAALVQFGIALDNVLLAMAMAALGLTTHVSALRSAGPRPLLLATMLFGWLLVGGLLINLLVQAWLG